MRIIMNAKLLAAIILVVILGGIAFSISMNWWKTEGTKIPAQITEGESAGMSDPADIRGSYTLADVERSFSIPVDVLKTAFALPSNIDAPSFTLKGLADLYTTSSVEIGPPSVRMFVALYNGLPYTIEGDIYLPKPAVEILKKTGKLSPENLKYIEAHALDVPTP